jgi:ribosomal protein S14
MAPKKIKTDNVVRDAPFGRKHGKCPDCGSRDSVPIVYGYPTEETVQRSYRGEIDLGGCIVMNGNPNWRCRECGRRF